MIVVLEKRRAGGYIPRNIFPIFGLGAHTSSQDERCETRAQI